jgi:hypothetical protein
MIAYNKTSLYNLFVTREMKQWYRQNMISEDQFVNISAAYVSPLYSPNIIIRILLFVASLLVLAGITGLLAMATFSSGEDAIGVGCVFYGVASLVVLDLLFIKSNNHYKSGVTEALLYHAMGFIIAGVALVSDGNEYLCLIVALILFSFSAIRYLDLISTLGAFISFAWLLFLQLYNLGGVFQQIIPFVFMTIFLVLHFLLRSVEMRDSFYPWKANFLVAKVFCLITVYLAGNYFVVQNLSESMMGIDGVIPFAWLFYFFTIVIPVTYLYIGIRYKNIVLLRISLLMIAFSAFTFKYYFSFGHPEITLTIAGGVVLVITLLILNYLKSMKHGYTRDNIYSEKWSNLNVEAFIISQTMGGNTIETQEQTAGGGGGFGGGGSTESF